MERDYILTVTGHRPNKISKELYDWNKPLAQHYIRFFINYIRTAAEEAKNHNVSVICRSGMALGIDTVFAIAALFLKRAGYPVLLHCYIPCSNHSSNWPKSSVDVYNKILSYADEVIYVSDKPYTNKSMQDRNIAMVDGINEDGCDRVLAIWDGTKGGTGNCVNYARSRNKIIDVVSPESINKTMPKEGYKELIEIQKPKLKVYTSTVYGYSGADKLDISVKSGTELFAPTWDMVIGLKEGRITEKEYIHKYVELMRQSYINNKSKWDSHLSKQRIVLCCYCKPGEYCHRITLAKILANLGAEYLGEI